MSALDAFAGLCENQVQREVLGPGPVPVLRPRRDWGGPLPSAPLSGPCSGGSPRRVFCLRPQPLPGMGLAGGQKEPFRQARTELSLSLRQRFSACLRQGTSTNY